MSITADFASPLSFESEEERRKREADKFLRMSQPLVDGILREDTWALQEEQRQQRLGEAQRFRDEATAVLQRRDEADRFREEASKLIPTEFKESLSPAGRFSDPVNKRLFDPGQDRVQQAQEELTAMGQISPDEQQRFDELMGIIEGKAPARHGEPNFPGVMGKLPGLRNPAELASTVGTAGVGMTGPMAARAFKAAAMTALGSLGSAGGGEVAEEAGAPKWTGELVGGLVGGAAGLVGAEKALPGVQRGLAEQGGVRGPIRRLATEETGGTKIPGRTPDELAGMTDEEILGVDPLESATRKFRTFAEGQRGKIAKTEAERGVERGSRIRAAEDAYQDAIAKGLSEEEAVARQQAALRGEYAGVEAEGIGWSVEERKAISDAVNTYDFGRGTGPDFERARARVAISKIGRVALEENELQTLEKVLPEFAREVRRMQASGLKDWGPALYDLATLQKTVLSAGDASYPGRQGIIISLAHPKEAVKSLAAMVKAAANGKVARQLDDLMRADERIVPVTMSNGRKTDVTLGEIAQSTGLFRALEAGVTSSEEVARSRLAYRIPLLGPIVKASNRSFATYGNKIRFETMATVLDGWVRQGVDVTPDKLEALSNALNRESGVGTLKGFIRVPGTKTGVSVGSEAFEKALQIPFWAPKYRVSHAQFALNLLHPDPQIRALAARDLSIFFGTGMSLLTFAELSGVGEVNLNPTSADFGKIRIGNTRINFWGTSQVLARSVAKLASGDVEGAARYFQSGLAPEWSLAYDTYRGENYIGQPMNMDLETFKREAQQRLIPLAMQDIKDAIEEAAHQPTLEKSAVAGAMAPFALLGGTASTYVSPIERLQQAYDEKVRSGAFGPDAKPYAEENSSIRSANVANDPELSKLNAARDTDFQKINLKTEEPLGPTAQAVQGNQPQAGTAYREQRGDVLAERAARKDQMTEGKELPTREADRLSDAYFALKPSDKNGNGFIDGEDFKAFYAERDALLKQMPERLRAALTDPAKRFSDPTVVEAERRYQKTLDAYKEYLNTPKYKGLTVEQGDNVDAARQAVDYLKNFKGTYQERRAIVRNLSAAERRVYYRVKGGSKTIQDPRRDRILMENPDLAYFGLVRTTTLNRKQRRVMPEYALQASLSQGALEAVR